LGELNLPVKPVPYYGKRVCIEKSSVAWCKNGELLLVRGWNGNCGSQCKFEIRRARKQKLPAGAGERYKHKHTYWQNGKRRKMKIENE